MKFDHILLALISLLVGALLIDKYSNYSSAPIAASTGAPKEITAPVEPVIELTSDYFKKNTFKVCYEGKTIVVRDWAGGADWAQKREAIGMFMLFQGGGTMLRPVPCRVVNGKYQN